MIRVQITVSSGSDGSGSTCNNLVVIPPGTAPNHAKQMIKDFFETGTVPKIAHRLKRSGERQVIKTLAAFVLKY